MDDLLYPKRSIDHLEFSPMKGIFYIFSLIDFVMKSLFETCTVLKSCDM